MTDRSNGANVHVSEILRAYARGELSDDARREADDHLDSCADCRAELDAVRVLAVGEEDALTELEGARMRDAVTRRTRPATHRARRWPAVVAGIGAAALIALGVVVSSGGGGGGSASSNAVQAPAEGINHDQVSTSGGASGANAAGVRPTPVFEHDASLTTSALRSKGTKGEVFQAYAGYFDASDAARLKPALTKQLAREAPSSTISSQIQRCTHTVLSAGNQAALPAFASATSFEDKPALVLGFAWTPAGTGPLDHYMFWAWPRNECGVPLTYETGRVKP